MYMCVCRINMYKYLLLIQYLKLYMELDVKFNYFTEKIRRIVNLITALIT